jgi:hypothetical protein
MHRSRIELSLRNFFRLNRDMDLSQPARQSEFEKSAHKGAATSKIERAILKIDTQNGQKRTRPDLRLEDEIIDPSRTMAFHPL